MKFKFDKRGIAIYTETLNKRVAEVKKTFTELLWKELYDITPRDTGAAAASWNISINVPNYQFDPQKKSNTLYDINNINIKDSLYISTGCPYMNRLNNGWSQKAPINFIQISVYNANVKLNNYLYSIGNKDF